MTALIAATSGRDGFVAGSKHANKIRDSRRLARDEELPKTINDASPAAAYQTVMVLGHWPEVPQRFNYLHPIRPAELRNGYRR